MKSKVTFSANSIKIQTPITFLFVFSVFGAVLGGIGIYKLGKITPYDHILIGLGIVILFFGLFHLLNTKYYKIHVNEDPGYLSLVESTGGGISPNKIPYKYFTKIVVQHIVNRDKYQFGVLLKNRIGALLRISKFDDKKQALEFAAKFEKTIGFPVEFNSVIPYDTIDSKHPYNPYSILLPEKTTIKTKETRDSREITWQIKYQSLQIAFMFVIYYGFYHMISFALIPAAHLNMAVQILIYLFLGFVLAFLIMAALSNVFGTHFAIINRESITYYNQVFGIKFGLMEMKKSDISLIRSSLDFSNEDMIILSRKGLEAVNNYKQKFVPGAKAAEVTAEPDEKDAKRIFKEEIMKLNESNLKLAEKLYIEQFILKNL